MGKVAYFFIASYFFAEVFVQRGLVGLSLLALSGCALRLSGGLSRVDTEVVQIKKIAANSSMLPQKKSFILLEQG